MKHRPGLYGGRNRTAELWSTCGLCARTGIHRAEKNSLATFVFHYAPCGRPCVGGVTVRLVEEDTPRGLHKGRDCADCKKVAVA